MDAAYIISARLPIAAWPRRLTITKSARSVQTEYAVRHIGGRVSH